MSLPLRGEILKLQLPNHFPSSCGMRPIMRALRVAFRLGLLIGLWVVFPSMCSTAQTTPPKEAQPPAPGLRKLSGDDVKRAEELDKAIDAALKADRWDEAIARVEEL